MIMPLFLLMIIETRNAFVRTDGLRVFLPKSPGFPVPSKANKRRKLASRRRTVHRLD